MNKGSALDIINRLHATAEKYDLYILTMDEWKDIQKHLLWLTCLEMTGVDNWEGYEEARRLQEEMIDG